MTQCPVVIGLSKGGGGSRGAANSSKSACELWSGKLSGSSLASAAKKTLYAPGLEEENEKTAFPALAIVTGFAGLGERMEIAAGEKNAKAEVPSSVENDTVSPLTTGTEAALGM